MKSTFNGIGIREEWEEVGKGKEVERRYEYEVRR